MRLTLIILALCFTAAVCRSCLSPTLAEEPIELIKNGRFETGDFSGWDADSNCAPIYRSTGSPHSGDYCARVGTARSSGTLSQKCRIPAKSAATLSFWYNVEKGCSLEARLIRFKDGSVIGSWTLAGTPWKSKRHELDPNLANEDVTVELTGTGYVEEVRVPVYDPVLKIYYYYYTYYYYYAYVDDVSLTAKVVAYEVKMEVGGLPRDFSTRVIIDGLEKDRITSGQQKTYTFMLGESHAIKVEEFVTAESGVRYYCVSNSASFSSDSTHTFSYVKQCFLKVESGFGSCLGEGWYNEGENAAFSVNPPSLPTSGLLGSLGAKYVFDRWSGDSSIASAEGTIIINGPKRISAVWREDYSQPAIVLSLLGIFGGSAALLSTRYAKKGRRAGFKQIFKGAGPAKEEEKPKIEPPALPREPEKVSDKAERERYLKRLEELKAQGKISDAVYERLKKKYQIEKE
nr:hypothetical protein [Candidatus Njordarchaeota archaeon]